MLSPSEFNNAVPKFTNGNYANNPVDPQYIEEPTLQDYNRGVEPLETLPAQWWNWLCNQFTSRFNKINTYVKNIFDEITQLLSLLNISPDGTESAITTGQLKNFFKELYPTYVSDKLELGTTYVPQTRTVNGHALTGNVTVTKSDVGLDSVVNTGDSASVSNGGTTKFTTGGAYNILTSIAPYFSTSTAYSVGALVSYENKFYECTTAHSAGAWNSSHFTERSVAYIFTNYILPSFAPTFSTATAYSVGTFVIYQNRLYKCTTAHSAGAWNSSHFALATLNDLATAKADKVPGATNNDIAILDANGNLKDSGISVADLTGVTDLAPLFSATASYAVGEYVIYNGNMYRCTVAHTGAWNANDFTQVTVGGELTNKADISDLAVPTDAVLHYSFDELPDYPDGTADVRLLKNWTSSDSSVWNVWNFTKSIIDSTLKLTTSGLASYGQFYSDYLSTSNIQNKIIKIKFKTTDTFTGVGFQDRGGEWTIRDVPVTKIGTNYYEVTYLVSFTVNYQQQLLFVFSDNTTTNFIIIEDLYIGDGSYSTPIIDNANGKWNGINYGIQVAKGVSGKGLNFIQGAKKNIKIPYNFTQLNGTSWSISFWGKIGRGSETIGKNPRIYTFGSFDYIFIDNYYQGYTENSTIAFVSYYSSSEYLWVGITAPSDLGDKFHHFTVVTELNLSGTSYKRVYIDGVLKGTATSSTIQHLPSRDFGYLGGNANTQYLENSQIDDFQVFDRALTEKEVVALYYNKANTPKYYNLNNYKIDNANVAEEGGTGKYIESIKQEGGLIVPVEQTIDTAPSSASTKPITSGAMYNFFGGNTDAKSWLSKAFGWAMGRYWNTCLMGGGSLLVSLNRTVYTIYYANNLWVAGSDKGIIWSEDGEIWDLANGADSYTFKHIYYAKGMWVACSTGQSLWWSTDGKTWTQGVGINTNYSFNHVYYAKNIWVACSESHGMYWSSNGKTWTQGTGSNTSYTFNDVYYGNNIWVAGSNSHGLWWSSDGKTWTQGTGSNIATYTFNSVRYADYIWVAGSNSHGLWWSSDGKAWNSSNISSSTVTINYIYYANGMWQACGEDRMLYSSDGKNFKPDYNPFLANCRSVYYANGTWVAGTDKGLIWSINGKNWQLGKGDERGNYSQCQFLCVYFAKNYWLAGGIYDSANFVQGFWYSDFDLVELKD